jgi:ankyrin repeat protein
MRDERMVRQLVANGAGHVTILRSSEEVSSKPSKRGKSDEDIVRLVLEKGANLMVTTKSPGVMGWEAPAFLHALMHNYQTLAMLLLERGADMTWTDIYGQSLLHYAASTSTLEKVIRKMIERGADVLKKASPHVWNITPLYQAARFANPLLTRLLIEHGADPMSQNSSEHNVFHAVLADRYYNCLNPSLGPDWIGPQRSATICTLLKYGSIALTDGRGNTGLHVAAFSDDNELAEVLLRRGVKVDALEYQGKTALHWAANSGSSTLVPLLLENGSNVNARDIYGNTPLHLAVKSGFAKIAKILVEAGADKDAQDEVGRTPLHLATRLKHTGILRLLLWKGVDLTIPDNRHRATALHFAAKLGDHVMVRMLLRKGADFSARNKDGETPLLLATKYGHTIVARILHESGADIFVKDNLGRGVLESVVEEVLGHPKRFIVGMPKVSTVDKLHKEKDNGVCYKMWFAVGKLRMFYFFIQVVEWIAAWVKLF